MRGCLPAAAEARQRLPAIGTAACLATRRDEIINVLILLYTHCVTRCFNAPNTLTVCPCLALSLWLPVSVWTTVLSSLAICKFERAIALAVYVIQICTISPE